MIRRLRDGNISLTLEHLMRIDGDTQRLRFGNTVGGNFLRSYFGKILSMISLAFGALVDCQICAIGELRMLSDVWPIHAEAAFSVKPMLQSRGIGMSKICI